MTRRSSGGNPLLPAQSQRDWRFGMDWELPEFTSAIQQARFRVGADADPSEVGRPGSCR